MKKIISSLLLMIVFLASIFGINYSVYSIFFDSFIRNALLSLFSIMLVLFGLILSNSFRNLFVISLSQLFYFYIGAIFILFTLSIILRFINIVLPLSPTINTIVYMITGTGVIVLSLLNTKEFHITTNTIYSKKLKKDYKIIHISDIHIGSNSRKFLKKIVSRVNAIEGVDFVCITGDLIDHNIPFKDIEPINDLRYKAFFIYGNHEHYIKQDNLHEILKKTNLHTINDSNEIINSDIQVVGINDTSKLDKQLKIMLLDKKKFLIVLNHQPREVEEAKKHGVNLLLCGHTHAGQIWPFNYLVKIQFKYLQGFHKHDAFHLNVNQGTGTWGPKMRLGSRNEISIIKLKKE